MKSKYFFLVLILVFVHLDSKDIIDRNKLLNEVYKINLTNEVFIEFKQKMLRSKDSLFFEKNYLNNTTSEIIFEYDYNNVDIIDSLKLSTFQVYRIGYIPMFFNIHHIAISDKNKLYYLKGNENNDMQYLYKNEINRFDSLEIIKFARLIVWNDWSYCENFELEFIDSTNFNVFKSRFPELILPKLWINEELTEIWFTTLEAEFCRIFIHHLKCYDNKYEYSKELIRLDKRIINN